MREVRNGHLKNEHGLVFGNAPHCISNFQSCKTIVATWTGEVELLFQISSLPSGADEIDKFVPGQNPKPTLIDSDTQSNSLSPLSHCIAGELQAGSRDEKKVHPRTIIRKRGTFEISIPSVSGFRGERETISKKGR